MKGTGRFLFGLLLGFAAGYVAKNVAENKDEYIEIAKEKYHEARENFEHIGEAVAKKAKEYKEYAEEQLHDFKKVLNETLDKEATEEEKQRILDPTTDFSADDNPEGTTKK